MSRDYAAEMRAVIDAETSHGPYVSRVIAREIVEKLEANDPDLLSGWLHAQAEQLVWGAINDRDRSMRASARTSASRSAFARAAEEHDGGDSSSLGHFLESRYVVEDGTRRALATLTKNDLLFVAQTYEDRAAANTFEAVFMRALAKKVRGGCVADHFTEEKIAALRGSLS
jgi:hypothetical protein